MLKEALAFGLLANNFDQIACEANTPINCNTDQLSFKSTYSRFLAATTKYAPWLYDDIMTYLAASASAAAATCTGTPGGDSCSTLWYTGSWVCEVKVS